MTDIMLVAALFEGNYNCQVNSISYSAHHAGCFMLFLMSVTASFDPVVEEILYRL